MKILAITTLLLLVSFTPAVAWHEAGHYGYRQSGPERFSGSSQQLGPFRFDTDQGNQGTTIWGQGQRLGNFQFDTFQDNRGNITNCTTMYLGNQAFTTCN